MNKCKAIHARHELQRALSTASKEEQTTYKDGGDDERAVGQRIRDVHPFSLGHFRDVETSGRTPLADLPEMKSRSCLAATVLFFPIYFNVVSPNNVTFLKTRQR